MAIEPNKGPLTQIAEYAEACYESSIHPMRQWERMRASGEITINDNGTFTWHKPKMIADPSKDN